MDENRGKVPQDVYETLPRVIPQATPEMFVFRGNVDAEELYLVQRPLDDPEWPGEWHVPGTTMYAHDTFEGMVSRLLDGELQGAVAIEDVEVIGHFCTTREERARGGAFHILCVSRMSIDSLGADRLPGKFWSVHDLPDQMLKHHRLMFQHVQELLEQGAGIPLANGYRKL